MRLISNWRLVLTKAWSARLLYCAIILSGLEAALPYLGEAVAIPVGILGSLSFIVTALALWARIVAQPSVHSDEE